ncbi:MULTISPECIES: hypothetical protein [unclassified Streptomyces]|uniref:hypothetical protein n=1 Tax=unclassified Streptomyces TaxID=2593676 RepID=UPI00081DE40B|nr:MULTISPECIES: hypothetical protein [unclassified Streptomyces]MYR29801.1 hypothetical protein [Streptomyces sp. SID4945]SCF47700.1 hypothetical protein GA0115257_119110 [Streptomyces sp. LcepLS]
MADEITTETTANEQGAATGVEPEEVPGLGDAGKRALAEERRARSEAERREKEQRKQLDTLSARLAEFEDRDKTESERLSTRATSAEKRAEQAEHSLLRLRVAAAKKLPPELADRLQGDTEDAVTADADRLLAAFRTAQTPSFDGGARTTARPTSMNDLIRRQAGHS